MLLFSVFAHNSLSSPSTSAAAAALPKQKKILPASLSLARERSGTGWTFDEQLGKFSV
jgi:hypothetical protein